MARRNVLGQTLRALERIERENARQQRLQEREYARQEKEIQKQKKRNALLNALDINWDMTTANFTFLSLKNNYKLNPALTDSIDNIENLNLILDKLKYGYRIDALNLLLSTTCFSYNEVIDIMQILENDLFAYLKNNKNCYDENEISTYEFAPQDEIFEIDGDVDYDTSRAEVYIDCVPLGTEDVIVSREPNVLQNKIQKLLTKLNDKYISELYKFHEKRENTIIENLNNDYSNILKITNMHHFSYEDLIDNSKFKSKLIEVNEPIIPTLKDIQSQCKELEILKNQKPKIDDISLPAIFRLLLHTPFKNISVDYQNNEFQKILKQWNSKISTEENRIRENEKHNCTLQEKYDNQVVLYKTYIEELKKEKNSYMQQQKEHNEIVYSKIDNFKNGNKNEIIEFFYNNLLLSPYPFLSHKDIEIDYNPNNKVMIINYSLPSKDELCNLKKIVLTISKKEFKPVYLKDNELNDLYNDILYKICIRSIAEIFNCDANTNFVDSIIYNGIIKHINDADGQEKISCIMTLQTNKEQFKNIDILNINAKNCFKSLKGIAAPELASLIPVQPILMINKNDSRFVEAYNVVEYVEDGYNLATMHWKDFENLVREIFEKEFCTQGSEVKITQSSRDGGVDAVIFDADPIRGGKIVIQAKRYTNVVGVSNVRDLYGTVLNEGAIKGILVTTSDYGADSYEFAKDKPLTLLNGNNLLHLLEKQGKKASINLQEAKEYFKNNE